MPLEIEDSPHVIKFNDLDNELGTPLVWMVANAGISEIQFNITKEQAQQIISHLQEQFKLNP